MQRIDFYVYDELRDQIDGMVNKYGFRSRAEFLRYAAIDFIRRESNHIPSDEALKKNTQALRAIKAGQGKEFI